jgi:hypothetical protein
MQLSGLKYGAHLLRLVDFPVPDFLTGGATSGEIQTLLDQHQKLVIKPVFHEAVGKKGKAGLVRVVENLPDALQAKRDLYFATHKHGSADRPGQRRDLRGVRRVGGGGLLQHLRVHPPAQAHLHHIAPRRGGYRVAARRRSARRCASTRSSASSRSTSPTRWPTRVAPRRSSARWCRPARLWDLYDSYGLTTIELNPVRLQAAQRAFLPVACDIKAAFDQDNPAWKRTGLPEGIFSLDISPFEAEINRLRTYQGQSDVLELNPQGTILPFMFGGGANSAATETLGDRAIFSSDFGGNPPYEKMYDIARIAFKHHLDAGQRHPHHRRQGQQHRHLRHLPRHLRRAARPHRHPRLAAGLRRGGARRPQPGQGHGLRARHARRAWGCPTGCSVTTPR